METASVDDTLTLTNRPPPVFAQATTQAAEGKPGLWHLSGRDAIVPGSGWVFCFPSRLIGTIRVELRGPA
jgi:hypothetical protein